MGLFYPFIESQSSKPAISLVDQDCLREAIQTTDEEVIGLCRDTQQLGDGGMAKHGKNGVNMAGVGSDVPFWGYFEHLQISVGDEISPIYSWMM